MATKLDDAVALRVANDHRATADSIRAQVQAFDGAVDLLDDVCVGAMLDALKKARDEWKSEVNRIASDLDEMAGLVDGTVSAVEAQDADNAKSVGNVTGGISILTDI